MKLGSIWKNDEGRTIMVMVKPTKEHTMIECVTTSGKRTWVHPRCFNGRDYKEVKK